MLCCRYNGAAAPREAGGPRHGSHRRRGPGSAQPAEETEGPDPARDCRAGGAISRRSKPRSRAPAPKSPPSRSSAAAPRRCSSDRRRLSGMPVGQCRRGCRAPVSTDRKQLPARTNASDRARRRSDARKPLVRLPARQALSEKRAVRRAGGDREQSLAQRGRHRRAGPGMELRARSRKRRPACPIRSRANCSRMSTSSCSALVAPVAIAPRARRPI